jgi:anti-sigma28 factor (negative regulator of flagellin synthesis)
MFLVLLPMYEEVLILYGGKTMRYSNGAVNRQAGNDSIHLAAMTSGQAIKAGQGTVRRKAGQMQAGAANGPFAVVQTTRGAEDGDVRFELVLRLRAAILAGTYRVAAADVAEKLMGSMLR